MSFHWFFPDNLPPLFETKPTDEDTQLACLLLEQLRRDPTLRHERICIEVQNRVVILEGVVSSPAARAEAHTHAWSIPGVHDVNNRLHPPQDP